MALVYSYIRFSSKRQAEGDSLRRQTEDGDAWIAENNHTKADLTLHDLGISAFRGKNKHSGALSEFLKLAKAGQIPNGSILLVEALDRLSREGVGEAYDLFRSILKTGVRIAVLKPTPAIYDSASLNDLIGMLIPLISFYLASLESQRKSGLIKKDREQKRKTSIESQSPIRTKDGNIERKCPSWISWNEEKGQFELNEGAKAVEFVFKQLAKGVGRTTVLKQLQEQFDPIGTSGQWNDAFIRKLLDDVSVLGQRQHYEFVYVDKERKRVPVGDPIPDYYPRAVSQKLWDRAQARRPGKAVQGRNSQTINLFKGLIVNAHDGYQMHKQRTARKDVISYRLVSYGRIRQIKGADRVGVSYRQFESVFLKYLKELTVQELLPPDVQDDSLAEKEQELADVRRRLADLADALADPNGGKSQTLVAAARSAEAREQTLVQEVELLQTQRSGNTPLVDAQSLIEAASDPVIRPKLAGAISRLVRRIYLKPEKHYGRVWWGAVIEFRSGQYRSIHCTPIGDGGTRESSEFKVGGWCGTGFSVDLTNPKSASSRQIFATWAKSLMQPVQLPEKIPDDLVGAAEYYLLQQKGVMHKENYKTLPSKIRRFVEVMGAVQCSDVSAKKWATYRRLLPKELGNTTARVAMNRSKEFCRWLISQGKMADFPELHISAAKLLPKQNQ